MLRRLIISQMSVIFKIPYPPPSPPLPLTTEEPIYVCVPPYNGRGQDDVAYFAGQVEDTQGRRKTKHTHARIHAPPPPRTHARTHTHTRTHARRRTHTHTKIKSFESRGTFFFSFSFYIRSGRSSCLRTCLDAMLLQQSY